MKVSKLHCLRGFWFFVAIASALGVYKYSHVLMPILDMDISVSRSEVIHAGVKVADDLQVDVEVDDVAVEFTLDDMLQSYVELEAGGKAAFSEIIKDKNFYPCQWHVRYFQEKRVDETHLWFSPAGKKIGFKRVLSEEEDIDSLSKSKAQYLLEKEAPDWVKDFCKYELVEYESEKRKNGRVDHTFVYQRNDIVIGQEGYYQLKLQVIGDKISGILPFIKIPDNFKRRFEQMRANNMLLTFVASFAYRFLYLFIFALLALIILYRKRWLLWRKALLVSFIVSGCYAATLLNDISLAWTKYNTVQAFSSFVMMNLVVVVFQFLAIAGMIFIALVAAESAGRFVYKNHIQFWKVFSWDALASYEVFWQVVYGYFYAMIMLGYVFSFVYLSTYWWGWWSPMQMLANPNILATYIPWLKGFGTSVMAGFMEEVVMRALPLSVVLLLAGKSKHKWSWFGIVFVLQVLIFGAAHAFYPVQPFYFRVVEIMVPATVWGISYYLFGLVPGVIGHYLYDLLLFSIPILVSNMLLQKIFVYFLLLLPLIVVAVAVMRKNKFYSLPASFYAKAWKAPAEKISNIGVGVTQKALPQLHRKYLYGFGLVALLSLGLTWHSHRDTAQLSVTKKEAISIASITVRKEVGELSDDWKPVTQVIDGSKSSSSKVIWSQYGKEVYDKLQGSYINDPCWIVRFVNFSLAVEDRKEEFKVLVNAQGGVVGFNHVLPEHGKGVDLSENAAKKIAYAWLRKQHDLSVADVTLLSHQTDKLTHRRDWEFVFEDLRQHNLLAIDSEYTGQARIAVTVSGDVVTKYAYSIYPSEKFTREEKARTMKSGMILLLAKILMFILMAFGLLSALYRLRNMKFSTVLLSKVIACVGVIIAGGLLGMVSEFVGTVQTAQPFYNQIIQKIILVMMNMPWAMLLYGILIFASFVLCVDKKRMWKRDDLGIIASIIVGGIAVQVGIKYFVAALEPSTTHYMIVNSFMPLLYFIFLMMQTSVIFYALLSAVFFVVQNFSTKTVLGIIGQFVAFMIAGAGIAASAGVTCLPFFAMYTLCVGLFLWGMYHAVLVYDFSYAPFVVISLLFAGAIVDILYGSYVYAAIYNVIALVVLLAVACGVRSVFIEK